MRLSFLIPIGVVQLARADVPPMVANLEAGLFSESGEKRMKNVVSDLMSSAADWNSNVDAALNALGFWSSSKSTEDSYQDTGRNIPNSWGAGWFKSDGERFYDDVAHGVKKGAKKVDTVAGRTAQGVKEASSSWFGRSKTERAYDSATHNLKKGSKKANIVGKRTAEGISKGVHDASSSWFGHSTHGRARHAKGELEQLTGHPIKGRYDEAMGRAETAYGDWTSSLGKRSSLEDVLKEADDGRKKIDELIKNSAVPSKVRESLSSALQQYEASMLGSVVSHVFSRDHDDDNDSHKHGNPLRRISDSLYTSIFRKTAAEKAQDMLKDRLHTVDKLQKRWTNMPAGKAKDKAGAQLEEMRKSLEGALKSYSEAAADTARSAVQRRLAAVIDVTENVSRTHVPAAEAAKKIREEAEQLKKDAEAKAESAKQAAAGEKEAKLEEAEKMKKEAEAKAVEAQKLLDDEAAKEKEEAKKKTETVEEKLKMEKATFEEKQQAEREQALKAEKDAGLEAKTEEELIKATKQEALDEAEQKKKQAIEAEKAKIIAADTELKKTQIHAATEEAIADAEESKLEKEKKNAEAKAKKDADLKEEQIKHKEQVAKEEAEKTKKEAENKIKQAEAASNSAEAAASQQAEQEIEEAKHSRNTEEVEVIGHATELAAATEVVTKITEIAVTEITVEETDVKQAAKNATKQKVEAKSLLADETEEEDATTTEEETTMLPNLGAPSQSRRLAATEQEQETTDEAEAETTAAEKPRDDLIASPPSVHEHSLQSVYDVQPAPVDSSVFVWPQADDVYPQEEIVTIIDGSFVPTSPSTIISDLATTQGEEEKEADETSTEEEKEADETTTEESEADETTTEDKEADETTTEDKEADETTTSEEKEADETTTPIVVARPRLMSIRGRYE